MTEKMSTRGQVCKTMVLNFEEGVSGYNLLEKRMDKKA